MADYNEEPFEREMCEHLAAHGWLYSKDSRGYDRARALFPEDIFGWLEDTQPSELEKVVKPAATEKDQKQSREQLLDRIVKVLDTPLESGGGTLNLLRKGFKHVSAKFVMCQFKPPTSNNPKTLELYGKVRVRVMRQVYYSLYNKRSVDLVLFINGLPVATLELKTDFTQSVQDAIVQYKTTRKPKDPGTGKPEPLFGFGSRALVHFAVSNDEVYMTTQLAGESTFFLPFNMGYDGGGGNPPNQSGSRTSYLWEQVFDRDTWLHIVGKFMHVQVSDETDPFTGKMSKKTTLLFPRFHQWQAVSKLVETARAEGPGHKYLIQHSAGSGKTNSISWAAHALATLHASDNKKVFDSVIVVTDRTVLDDQLQEAIRQIDPSAGGGVVVTVTGNEAGKAGLTSKSALLANALTQSKLIVVVTIQTFPFALDAIRKTKGLKDKKFAVLADEAHSSQTGATANKLKAVLTAEELAEFEDDGEVDVEAILSAEMTARADSKNISYFAFTATPKAKTLELFGRKDASGTPQAFHVYTMQQAIEEGFILDVLRNYTDYDTAFQLDRNLRKAGSKDGGSSVKDDKQIVDETEATKGLMRWVKLHPTNISQKVQIIVEHFRVNVEHLLDGHAKAMVVTDSRKAAVRYKHAIDKYIKDKDYAEITVLVAFSGDDVPGMDPSDGLGPFNERTLNPGLKGRDLRAAFATDDYRVMLVANKFQTGFDQPLLCAMYIDKQLSGVTAVQTLSRLNRTLPSAGKDTTYVLDFVNEPGDILAAFKPYYRQATLTTETDPNLIHDLQAKLDAAGIYTDAEVDALVTAWIMKKGNNALAAAIDPAKHRFKTRWMKAQNTNDKPEINVLDLFRKDVATFIRLYDFMSQIVDYGDTDLEKRSIFLRLLERQIRSDNLTIPIDFSDVELRHIKQIEKDTRNLDIGQKQKDEDIGLHGIRAAGSTPKRDPKLVLLDEVIARINELFADEDFTAEQKFSWVEALVTVLLANEMLREQAARNSRAQFLESPDLADAITEIVAGNQATHGKMADRFYADGKLRTALVEGLGKVFHQRVRQDVEAAQAP